MGLAGFNLRRREQAKKEKAIDYDSMTYDDLRNLGKEKGIENYANIKKGDLITALKESDKK